MKTKSIFLLVFRLTVYATGVIALIACASSAGSDDQSVIAALRPQLLPPTKEPVEPPACLEDLSISVKSNPSTITYGQSSTVSWSVDVPSPCVPITVKFNGRSVARSGSQTVTPSRTTSYRVSVSFRLRGIPGETSGSAAVTVGYPSTVVIDQNTSDPVGVLLGALRNSTNPTQTVELCSVDLDLTGYSNIVLGDNRSLIASPGCERNLDRLGPRIFVTDKRGTDKPLFVIHGDNVVISGFQLAGPTSDIGEGDNNEDIGIKVRPYDIRASPVQGIEISNLEISQWSGAGIYVTDTQALLERGRLFNTNVKAVHIKNNYFHHNRHYGGEGYGVEITGGAYALIEQNVFDENRHAIAGGSRSGNDATGYTARDNLILPGGGVHDCYIITCSHTHQIDMHGDGNIGNPPCWWCDSNKLCGTAGETIMIERNTIFYTEDFAIKIRGNPADKAVVDGNIFVHQEQDKAIDQNGSCGLLGDNISNPIDVRPNNIFDANPMAELGSCDFSGDGQEDQFMATGVTWWAKSPTTQQWRYLNTMPQTLSQIRLAKVDGDNVCDVVPGTWNPAGLPVEYSKSGMGPWESPLGGILDS